MQSLILNRHAWYRILILTRMKKKLLIIAVIVLALVAGSRFLTNRRKSVTTPQIPPNILLITIDTIRPDRLSSYGSSNATPNLDKIASEGLLFENAFSQVPLTFPSHTSILTGMFPVRHGVHQNGLQIFDHPDWTLSRVLRGNGYRTGAVVSAFVLDRKFGLASDFEVYDDRMERSPGISSNFDVERKGQETTDAALRIIESFSGSRWFVWVHYYDPHTPYDPPSPLSGYDGEVQFVDQQIGRLRSRLAQTGLDKNLAIAVVGDHGESLGEHGEETHGFFIYNSTVKVPLILSYPGVKPARVSAPAATVDLAPTFLQLAGIKDTVARDGKSLLEVAAAGKRDVPILMESRYAELFGWNRLEGMLDDRWKFIATTRSELYAWQEDSSESTNLYAREESVSRKLRQQLSKYESTENAKSGQPDSETLEKLKSLGYISSATLPQKRGTADPKDKITVWAEYERSLQLRSAGRKEESLQVLTRLAEKEPENPFLRTAVASELRESGRPGDAIPQVQAAIQSDPANASAYQELALAYRDMRNYPEAVRAIEAAVALEPHRSELHGTLGFIASGYREVRGS